MNAEVTRLFKEVEEAKNRLREAQRRTVPEPVEDWTLKNPDGSSVRLSELFGGRPDLLLVHNMGKKCPYCTLWADGLRGYAPHLENRAAFVLCSDDDPATLKEFAAGRGWNFHCVSGAGSGFAKALGYADPNTSEPWPGVSAFKRTPEGKIVRTGDASFGPGDDFCIVWPMLDLFPEGAGGWEPKYAYAAQFKASCGAGCGCGKS